MSDPPGDAADTAIGHAAADVPAGVGASILGTQDTYCLNSGKALVGEFCHACGQGAQIVRRPFWSLVAKRFETLFAVNGCVARTLPNILLHPGRMTLALIVYSNAHLYRLSRAVCGRGPFSCVMRTVTLDSICLCALLMAVIFGALSL